MLRRNGLLQLRRTSFECAYVSARMWRPCGEANGHSDVEQRDRGVLTHCGENETQRRTRPDRASTKQATAADGDVAKGHRSTACRGLNR